MNAETLVFLLLIFLTAVLYSSVGHGGASGYLAIMSFFHVVPETMRPAALLLNIIVSGMAWFQYSKKVKADKKLLLWLLAGSIPAAFAGSGIKLDDHIYKLILGILLLFPAARLLGIFPQDQQNLVPPVYPLALISGLLIGFLSGIIGIGGGILLSPLLIFLRWTDMRQTALISSIFIFLNSLSGMAGILSTGAFPGTILYLWIAVALGGGALGAWLGSHRLTPPVLKRILGVVLLVAGGKLMFFQ